MVHLNDIKSEAEKRQIKKPVKVKIPQKHGGKEAIDRMGHDQKKSSSKEITEQSQSNYRAESQSNYRAITEQANQLQSNYRANHVATTEQLQSNHRAKPPSFYDLSGWEKDLIIYVFEMCQIEGSKTSPRLAVNDFFRGLKMMEKDKARARNHIQNILKRTVDKGLLIREKARPGRGGWIQLRISEMVYKELLLKSNHRAITEQSQSNYRANYRAEYVASPPSSSSININTTTEDPQSIDLKPLESINFSKHHLKQIRDQKILSDDEIQKSIEAFSFDLTNNHLGKVRSPLNFFMKILKNGSPYVSDHYQDPEELLLKEKLERARKEKVEKEKRKEEYLELKFNEWLEKQEQEELKVLVPIIGEYMGQFHRANLKEYFRQEVFVEQN